MPTGRHLLAGAGGESPLISPSTSLLSAFQSSALLLVKIYPSLADLQLCLLPEQCQDIRCLTGSACLQAAVAAALELLELLTQV